MVDSPCLNGKVSVWHLVLRAPSYIAGRASVRPLHRSSYRYVQLLWGRVLHRSILYRPIPPFSLFSSFLFFVFCFFCFFLFFFWFVFWVYSNLFPICLLFFRFSLCTFARALQANGLCPLPTLDKTRCAALSSCVGVLLPWNLCTWLTRSRQSSSSLSLPDRALPTTGLWSPMGF